MLQFHPEYNEKVSEWQEAIDFYNAHASTRKVGTYLEKKTQRETDDGFKERQKTTEPMLLFPTAVDGLCGIMFNNEDQAIREWGAFGDPENPDDIAYRLKQDADGEGMDWQSLFKMSAIKLTTTHRIWGVVDGLKEIIYNEGTDLEEREKVGDATIHVLDPTFVINWYPSNGQPEQVVVKEKYDSRRNIDDPFPLDDVYIKFDLDGWERFRIVERNEGSKKISEMQVMNAGSYEFYRTKEKKDRILPIYKVEIPMPRDVGFLLARKERAIWNLQSVRDFAVRALSFALFRVMVEGEDDWNKIKKALMEGTSLVPQYAKEGHPHDFISADASWLTEAGEILKKKVEDFFHSAFKEYGDAARQRTVPEIRLESQTGIEAFLALLVDSVDEFENQALWRMEQIYFDNPSQWGQASVTRSRDFTPQDEERALELMKESAFGERIPIPFPIETLIEVVRKAGEKFGLSLPENDEPIRQAIETATGQFEVGS